MTVKEEAEEAKTEKNTKKSTKKDTTGKKTLIELVDESGVSLTSIVMDLSMNGLSDQYDEEVALKKAGMPIVPSITETEFKKIIGD